MIDTLVLIFSYIFDITLLYFYVNIFLKDNKKNSSKLIYWGSYIIAECVVAVNTYLLMDIKKIE